MIQYTRQTVPKINPVVAIKDKSDDDIAERLETIFRNVAQVYRNMPKPVGTQNEKGDDDVEENDETAKRNNRRKGRKSRVRPVECWILNV
jgi:hypothetical protein